MGKNLYVGNLSFDTSEEGLRGQFEQYGTVESAKIITDRETGRSRGFGFVEMDTAGGEAAIQALNGKNIDGRDLKVNEAKPREPRNNNRW
jgi:RNA recognition motif-containing protein